MKRVQYCIMTVVRLVAGLSLNSIILLESNREPHTWGFCA